MTIFSEKFRNTFRSLKYRNYSIFFVGQFVSLIGSWIQQIALGWLIFDITNSVFYLSVATFLNLIPTLIIAPFTGVVSDKFDRKKILLFCQFVMLLQSLILATLIFTDSITYNIILALCFIFGLNTSFEAPARQSLVSLLVQKKHLSNAIALNSTIFNSTRFLGPAIGGLMIAHLNIAICFLFNSLTFIAIIVALLLIKTKQEIHKRHSSSLFAQTIEGFKYALNTKAINITILLLVFFSFFGMPLHLLMPAFAKLLLNADSIVLGNLMSCIGLGAVSASLYLASRQNVLELVKIIKSSSIIFGISLCMISFTSNIFLAYIICVVIGFGITATAASCNTILQEVVMESKRGRIMSIFTMCVFGLPPLGSLIQGILSDYISLNHIILISGLMCILASIHFNRNCDVIIKKIQGN